MVPLAAAPTGYIGRRRPFATAAAATALLRMRKQDLSSEARRAKEGCGDGGTRTLTDSRPTDFQRAKRAHLLFRAHAVAERPSIALARDVRTRTSMGANFRGDPPPPSRARGRAPPPPLRFACMGGAIPLVLLPCASSRGRWRGALPCAVTEGASHVARLKLVPADEGVRVPFAGMGGVTGGTGLRRTFGIWPASGGPARTPAVRGMRSLTPPPPARRARRRSVGGADQSPSNATGRGSSCGASFSSASNGLVPK